MTDSNWAYFDRPDKDHAAWAMLIEKASAKMIGTYDLM